MNKERELLKRVIEVWETCDGYEDLSVFEEIRTYLNTCPRCGKENPADIHTCTPRQDHE